MRARALVAVGIAATAIALLSGCAGGDPTTPERLEHPDGQLAGSRADRRPRPSESFAMPADCASMLPAERIDSFEAQGLVLLGGPGGLYGEDYLLDPTPEEAAGGITCIWGDELVPESTVTVSVAPLRADTRSGIVEELIDQGLNETPLEDAITYSRVGDEVSSPAIINVLRNELVDLGDRGPRRRGLPGGGAHDLRRGRGDRPRRLSSAACRRLAEFLERGELKAVGTLDASVERVPRGAGRRRDELASGLRHGRGGGRPRRRPGTRGAAATDTDAPPAGRPRPRR